MNSPGDEFRIKAAPTQEQLRKLLYLATQDSDSVITPGRSASGHHAGGSKGRKDGGPSEMLQLLEAQQRQERIALLDQRLSALEITSAQALREAEERLDAIRRNANRAADGRLVFQDIDGTVYDEDGNEVAADEVDWSIWDPSAADRQEYLAAQDAVVAAGEFRREVEEARDALESDPDDDALDALDDRLDVLENMAAQYEPAGATTFPSAEPNDPARGRATSAAKAYDADPFAPTSAALRDRFAGTVIPSAPTPEPPPAGSGPRPDAPDVPGH